jgi:hypothetical protein
MADSTVSSNNIILLDLFPGAPGTKNLAAGFSLGDDATNCGHNVSMAAPVAAGTNLNPLGTKAQVYNTGLSSAGSQVGVAGFSTFIYLKVGTQSASLIAAGSLVTTASTGAPYVVTNLNTAVGNGFGPCAVAVSAMTNGYGGWFWCGGVCPTDFVAAFVPSGTAITLATDGTLVVGDATAGTLAAGSGTIIGLSTPTTGPAGRIAVASHADVANT